MKKLFILLMIFTCIYICSAQEADSMFTAADQSLLTIPTAYTMPKGMSSFTNYEVLLLQFAHAVSNRVHLSAGMVFPITGDMLRTFTIGTKVNYLNHKILDLAAFASFSPNSQVIYLGNVLSYGNTKGSLHLMISRGQNLDENEGAFLYGLGGITRLSPRTSGIMELYSLNDVLSSANDDITDVVLLFGIRFRGAYLSWDLGGIRPLGVDSESLLAFPFIKATYIF